MRVLVTGAAGFLGSHVGDALIREGHTVAAYDDLSGGSLRNVPTGCTLHIRSILDRKALESAARGCGAIVHCAALAYEGLSVFSPSMVAENVVVGSVNVMVAAANAKVRRVLNCSSMARYGRAIPPYYEHQEPFPVDPYGAAKLAAEQQMNLLGKVHDISVVHAVPHNIYGPGQKYDDPYRNVAAIMLNRVLQGKPPVVYGDGSQTRCFSYVDDVVPTLLQMLLKQQPHGEVYNVGPDTGAVSIRELAATVCAVCGVEPKFEFHKDRPCEIKHATCSASKVRRVFGFESRVGLADGLTALRQHIAERGPKSFDYNLPLEIDSELTPLTWKEKLL